MKSAPGKKTCFLAVLLFSFIMLFCFETSTKAFQRSVFVQELTLKDGLVHNRIINIIKDRNGFILVGTDMGLCRYDGYQFIEIGDSLPDNKSLSESQITGLYEDRGGYLWIGTSNGDLYRYNPEIESFKPLNELVLDSLRSTDISINEISGFDNMVYVTSTSGLYKFSIEEVAGSDKSKVILEDHLFSSYVITSVMIDHLGIVWVGTQAHGLFQYDERIDKLISYDASNKQPQGISNNHINCLMESPDGNVLIGTWGGGLNILYRNSGTVKTYTDDGNSSLNSGFIFDLELDHTGKIWIGTYLGSLFEMDNFEDPNQKASITETIINSDSQNSEIDNCAKVIHEDETGFLWIGTLGNGIKKFYPAIHNINHYQKDDSRPGSLNNNDVTTICQDHLGGIWLGTWGGGVDYTYPEQEGVITNKFIHFVNDPEKSGSISGNLILCIFEDSNNNIWIGTFMSGLNRLVSNSYLDEIHVDKTYFERYYCRADNGSESHNASINQIYESSSGDLLIGTDRGLMKLMQTKSGHKPDYEFMNFKSEFSDGIKSDKTTVLSIIEYPDDVLWLGTLNNGLIMMTKDSSDFGWRYDRSYLAEYDEDNSLSNNTVRSIIYDDEGDLWIGTNNGVNKFHIQSETFEIFSVEHGMSNRNISKIVDDKNGNLWISTELGINRFNLRDNTIKNYIIPGEASRNDFNWDGGRKFDNGDICFGSNGGLFVFNPLMLTENSLEPPVVFTRLQIANNSIDVGKKGNSRLFLPKSVNFIDELKLPNQYNTFSIEFSGLNFYLEELNEYRYKLEGYHDTWINTDYNGHIARFYNIPTGRYTFMVIASNNDGLWNETGRELQIRILPPFWASWWAYLLYTTLILIIIYYAWKISRMRVQMKYELELEKMRREKGEEVNQMKLKFFTSVSHEFMTPLTLIISPLEKLIHTTKSNIALSQKLIRINKNAKRLLYMVNELMDFRRIETGKIDFHPASQNINELVSEVYLFFDNYAQDHNIQYVCSLSGGSAFYWFDYDKLEKILFNLVSNAFKYTKDNGCVTICIPEDNELKNDEEDYENSFDIGDPIESEFLEIWITDTGAGIPKENLPKIFERFYQINDETTSSKQGTGIGLSLVKEFVLIHKGNILVESTVGEGTRIKLRIPSPFHLSREIIQSVVADNNSSDASTLKKAKSFLDIDTILDIENESSSAASVTAANSDKSSYLILIVEDNVELRVTLVEHFRENYRVIEAENGEEAISMTVKHSPDLVICDIMMPVMDGLQFCKELRENIHISHTPVILLTAHTDIEHKIEGISTGADSYIMKPFSFRYLDANVNNLLESRAKLRQQFSKKINVQPSEVTVTPRDERILTDAIKYVEDNLSREDLGVDDLGGELGFSRSQLYRKLKDLTSLGPNEFIRSIRLKVAAQLLIKEKSTVSEILYKVGFNNRSYFASCFKKEFGLSPREYQIKYAGK